MKKVLGIILSVMLAVMCFATVASAADISVELDGEKLEFEQPPVIIEERTLVPLRAIFEALDASVDWDDATKTVTSVKGDVTVKLTIGSNILYKNDEAKELDVPAQIVGEGYTMVPARAIAEAYGVGVDWIDETKTVVLTSPAPVEVAPKVEGELFSTINAETYVQSDNIYSTGTESRVLAVVDNPLDASDKVFLLDANVTDKSFWTYLWAKDADFVPGQRYVAEFDILLGETVTGNKPSKGNVGICFRFAEEAGAAVKDHGVGSTDIFSDAWSHVICVYTVPSTIDASAERTFGIFLNPHEESGYDYRVAGDYYIDNVSVVPYSGALADGVVFEAEAKKNEEMANFDIDAAEGIVFDFETDECGFTAGKVWGLVVEDGHLTMTIPEESNTDVQAKVATDFAAADYSKVAFKVKGSSSDFFTSFFSVYFITDSDDTWTQSKNAQIDFKNCTITDDGYVIGILDMSENSAWTGKITSVRIDPCQGIYGTVSVDKVVIMK